MRRQYYEETSSYKMLGLDASNRADIDLLPDADSAIIIMEGISMYLSREKLVDLLKFLKEKYDKVHILMDVYTEFGARTSKYKNPVNDVGVQKLYGNELKGFEKIFFKLMFTGKLYSKIYRLYELGKNKIKILLNKCTLKIC